MKSTRALMTNQYLELEQELVISQCSWLTQPSLAAPHTRTPEEQERSRRLYEHIVRFLQDNRLTTRRILAEGERVTDETAIRVGDLTPEGFCFYSFGILAWLDRYGRNKDKDKAINDLSFIEKKLKTFREQRKAESVRLRPLTPKDAPCLARLADNKRIWDNLRDYFPNPYSLDDAKAFIQMTQQEQPQRTLAIEAEGALVGVIGVIMGTDIQRLSAEIGYWLGEPHWGRGIATEAVRQMTDYAFGELGLVRVFAMVYPYNKGSQRVLEKSGYQLEGIQRLSVIKNGLLMDSYYYVQLSPRASEYPQV